MQKKTNSNKRNQPNRGYIERNKRKKFPKTDKVDKAEEWDVKTISGKNDWRYYATNEQLVKDTASFPYGYALGTAVDLGPYGADSNKGALPGIMSLLFVPTVGWSDNPNSPINVASRSVYTDVRRTNSGGTNYDPVDLMIYLVGMDSCYMCLEFFKRAYGVVQNYSPVNRYTPRALVRAMGFDFDSLSANLADFRAAINIYAQKLKSLVIPNGMAYMAKHKWMVEGIYQDHPTDKSQYYLFVPGAFYKFGLDSDGAGMLSSVNWYSYATVKTVPQAIQFMNDLLDPLLANQDFATMSGDILKWRGENGVVKPTGITETFQVFPTYDETVLDQINNASALGPWAQSSSAGQYAPGRADGKLEIRQDTTKSYLVSKPAFKHPIRILAEDNNPGRNVYLSKRFINFMHDGIKPEETLEATRMCNIADDYETSSYQYDWFNYHTIGSEVLTTMIVWQYAWNNAMTDWELDYHTFDSMSDGITIPIHSGGMTSAQMRSVLTEVQYTMRQLQRLSVFDRHPMIAFTGTVFDEDGTLSDLFSPFCGYMNDINYYTIIDAQDLKQMAEIALLSEFNVRMQEV